MARIDLATTEDEDTRALAAAMAEILEPGDIVSLSGQLGAGKTRFVQGAARALGVNEPVTSPTFVLVREYHGRLPIFHADVYRLTRVQDAIDLGLDEMLDGEGVTFIEWGDGVESLFGDNFLRVEMAAGDEETGDSETGDVVTREGRSVTMSSDGPSWHARWERLEKATEDWQA